MRLLDAGTRCSGRRISRTDDRRWLLKQANSSASPTVSASPLGGSAESAGVTDSAPTLAEVHGLATRLKAFAQPDRKRSIAQLLTTGIAFLALWVGMWFAAEQAYWLTLLLSVPAAAFLVRLFAIQHDCGHGAFFRSTRANNIAGRILGVITLTPYDYWRRAHAAHHATSGNLDRRGIGDIHTLTVAEYRALGGWARFAYRFYRHPLVLFGLGPTYLFVLKHRLPVDLPWSRREMWLSVLATNLAIAGAITAMILTIGPLGLVKIHVPVILLASSLGVWLFFIQHQFEGGHWRHDGDWNVHLAALQGSSHYVLPGFLRWMTASIGLHHVHHLCSRIPNYRLQDCVDQLPDLAEARRITLWQSLGCARLALWDEARGRMVRFRDLRREN
jgi:omega-6 fatty acid desaturase (delta-12 desaturase)